MPVRSVRLFLVLRAAAALCLAAGPSSAQTWRIAENDRDCHDHNWNADHCEVRETTLTDGRNLVRVDGGQNGGVSVEGGDGDSIVLRARIHAWDRGGTPA